MKYSEIKQRASKLRCNQTPTEKILWSYLRKRQLLGYKFLRQHPIIYDIVGDNYFFFVPDFYCSEIKLIIELDGKIHESNKEKDKHRDKILESTGVKVLRIKNEEMSNIDKVLDRIESMILLIK